MRQLGKSGILGKHDKYERTQDVLILCILLSDCLGLLTSNLNMFMSGFDL